MSTEYSGKLIIFSAPSGAGKSTIVGRLLEGDPRLSFSISATSRPPRGSERDGVEYFFLSPREFESGIEQGRFVEWEEVYGGTYYGTLQSELSRLWAAGKAIVFDVDVMGGLRLKEIFGERALSVFVMPPSIDELRRRLTGRGTDSPERIEKRLAKARFEIDRAGGFDRVVLNDDLETAVAEVRLIVDEFMRK